MKPGKYKYWRQLSVEEYAALFPAKPKALRKIAYGLRKLGAQGVDGEGDGSGHEVFTIDEWELARRCRVSRRTLQRYLPLFETYGILEAKRWRQMKTGALANSYRLHFGNVIPDGWAYGGGNYPISAVQRPVREPLPDRHPDGR